MCCIPRLAGYCWEGSDPSVQPHTSFVYPGEHDYIAKLLLLCRRHLHTALCRCSRKVNVLEHRSITCQKLKSLETYYFVCLNICLNCIRFCSASMDMLAITEALRNFLGHYNDDSADWAALTSNGQHDVPINIFFSLFSIFLPCLTSQIFT